MDEALGRFVAVIIWALIAKAAWDKVFPPEGQWMAVFYPRANETLLDYRYLGNFDTLNDCRAVALDAQSRSPVPGNTDYECGFKCKIKPGWTVYTCDKTEK